MRGHLVDLVIPVFNEAHVLAHSVERLYLAAEQFMDCPWHIVVVDNGSTDQTRPIGEQLAQRFDNYQFLHLTQKGRGQALLTAWTETEAEFSIYMDVDLSTELEAVPTAIRVLREGADIVSGSRLAPDSHIQRCLKREILSRGYNWLIRILMGVHGFDDAQCGFKGVRVATVRSLLPSVQNRNWFFDTELLILAECAGLTIRTFPIQWVEDPDTRVNIPMTILEDVRGLLRLRRTARRTVRDWIRAQETDR